MSISAIVLIRSTPWSGVNTIGSPRVFKDVFTTAAKPDSSLTSARRAPNPSSLSGTYCARVLP